MSVRPDLAGALVSGFRRRPILALAVVFVVTRLLAGWVADHPSTYPNRVDVTPDVGLYESWADRLPEGDAPYSDLNIEYPPGALPVFVAPAALLPNHSYRTAFIAAMILVDAAGLVGLVLISRRRGRWHGAWFWVLVVPLMGPVLYTRFDLVAAVTVIWAVERATVGRWTAVGGWLGLGTAVKLFPLLLLPVAWVLAPRRRRVLFGAALVGALIALPLAGVLDDVFRSVIERNQDRGLHAESLFGSLLLVADRFGYDVEIVFQFGAFDAISGLSDTLKALSTVLVVAAVAEGAVRSWRLVPRESAVGFAVAGFGTLAVATGVAPTYSPQFVIWVLAAGAAALALAPRAMAVPAGLLVAVAVLNHLFYPVFFFDLFPGRAPALAVLVARNLVTITAGVLALRALGRLDQGPDARRGDGDGSTVAAGSRPSEPG